ncbi:MAG: hypothetical protein E7218_06965 [Anaerofustis stercorihominis]|nr:hypothetical protein [Anaerofustis stercorihominis]
MQLSTVFNSILQMSIISSIVILTVLIIRLPLKKVPKVFSYILWGIVLFRLLCPVSIISPFSLFNTIDYPEIVNDGAYNESHTMGNLEVTYETGEESGNMIPGNNETDVVDVPHSNDDSFRTEVFSVVNPYGIIPFIWFMGATALAAYGIYSLIKLRRSLMASLHLTENIYLSDYIPSPFVIGFIKPEIYLPSGIGDNEREYIILHEKHHIRRGDHIVKILFYVAVCLHWFNPLVWLSFVLCTKDMEMSCDEAVIKKLGESIKSEYSMSLLNLSVYHKRISPTPLAFGEGDTKDRIKNLAKWSKPAKNITIVSVIIVVIWALILMTDPYQDPSVVLGSRYYVDNVVYDNVVGDKANRLEHPSYEITADMHLYLYTNPQDWWEYQGRFEEYYLTNDELKSYMLYDDGWTGSKRIGKITDSYILRLDNEHFFIVFRTKDATYLGYGREDISERYQPGSDDTSISTLYELKSSFENKGFYTGYISRSLKHTLNKEVNAFYYTIPEHHENYAVVGFLAGESEIPSEMTDMGYAVFRLYGKGEYYELVDAKIYPDAVTEENGIYFCSEPAVLNESGELNAEDTYDVVLSVNNDLATVKQIAYLGDGTTQTREFSTDGGYEMILMNWDFADEAGVSISTHFLDVNGEQITDKKNTALTNTNADMPFGRAYEMQHMSYSYVFGKEENAPENSLFLLSSEKDLYVSDESDASGFRKIGRFEEEHISPANFDEYFKEVDISWRGFPYGAERIRKTSKKVWRLDTKNENGEFYILVLSVDNELYLTYGYDGNEGYPENDKNAYMQYVLILREKGRNGIIHELDDGTYVSRECIYLVQHSSRAPGSDSGFRYIIQDGTFTVDGKFNEISVKLNDTWQRFPWTDEQWNDLFFASDEGLKDISQTYGNLIYMPLTDDFCLINADGSCWVVEFASTQMKEKYIYSIYTLVPLISHDKDLFKEADSPHYWAKNVKLSDILMNSYTNLDTHIGTTFSDDYKAYRSLIAALNCTAEDDFVSGQAADLRASLMLNCSGKEYLLVYDGENVGMVFDSETAKLYGDKKWLIKNDELSKVFEALQTETEIDWLNAGMLHAHIEDTDMTVYSYDSDMKEEIYQMCTASNKMFVKYSSDDEWNNLGNYVLITLTENNFDILFVGGGWRSGYSASTLRTRCIQAWQAGSDSDKNKFMYLELNNGENYLIHLQKGENDMFYVRKAYLMKYRDDLN